MAPRRVSIGFLDGQEEAEPWLGTLYVWGTSTAQSTLRMVLTSPASLSTPWTSVFVPIITEVLIRNDGSQKAATKVDSVTVGTRLEWSNVAPEGSWL